MVDSRFTMLINGVIVLDCVTLPTALLCSAVSPAPQCAGCDAWWRPVLCAPVLLSQQCRSALVLGSGESQPDAAKVRGNRCFRLRAIGSGFCVDRWNRIGVSGQHIYRLQRQYAVFGEFVPYRTLCISRVPPQRVRARTVALLSGRKDQSLSFCFRPSSAFPNISQDRRRASLPAPNGAAKARSTAKGYRDICQ